MTTRTLRAADVGQPVFEFETSPDINIFALSSHQRAHEALALGLARPGPQYNIYVLGPDQAGRMTATRAYIEKWANAYPPAEDWLYLADFDAPDTPRPVTLPAGGGAEVRDVVDELIPSLARELANAFSGEAYQQQVAQLQASDRAEIEGRTRTLETRAEQSGLALVQTPAGPVIAARDENGEPVPLQTLPVEERERRMSAGREIMETLAEINRDAMRLQQRLLGAIQSLEAEVAKLATIGLVQGTAEKFAEHELLRDWFAELATDVVANYQLFLHPEHPVPTADPGRALARYAVNLLVDRRHETHRPVVVEQNPTYDNVFGKIEYRQVHGGGLETDVSLIKSGSLHRANGGVLIVRASDIAAQPGVWIHLKAALRDGEIRIEEFYRAGAPPVAGAPKPTPIPLDISVVLIGAPSLYHLFFAVDPEFSNYFKVKAHIEPLVDATPDNLSSFAGLLTRFAKERGVELTYDALQLLLGVAARWAGHRRRISTQFEAVSNLIEEACNGCEVVDKDAVRGVIDARRRRNSYVEDEAHRAIVDKLTIISVTGQAIGQINGLTVQDVGDHIFGCPARITARASVGRRGVINIERMVAMSGPIQQKGTLVLQGLLMRWFARHAPTSFDCSVTFEQLYGGVEGDSASLAEYIAIVSDLADLPIRQDLAITGSVNQLGEAQVIGGVHHKIEGFFRVCQELGPLTGGQGVVLPAGNEQHLVLRDDVTAAIGAGLFNLYSVESVDDAVELFTGLPVGNPAEPSEETVYGRVVKSLNAFDAILAARGL
ncbi:MAG: putative ATP-dependent protease [Gammaproteobacteria bacterium]|jgi:predicted ATP-dependent protease